MQDPNRIDAAHDVRPEEGAIQPLVIAATPRTASTMLAMSLGDAGVGVPAEYLNPLVRSPLAARWHTPTLAAYLAAARAHRTVGGVFALKTHFNHFAPLSRRPELLESLEGAAWVSLSRIDQIAQAVSLHLARVTGRWWSGGRRRFTRYDAEAIHRRVEEIRRQDIGWQRFFMEMGIEPLRVFTEDLVDEPTSTMGRVLSHLGIEATPRVVTAPSGDPRVGRWAARFRQEPRREI